MGGEPRNRSLTRRWHLRRYSVVVAVWAVATALGLAVAATTRIRPVLLTLSRDHGVHLGDMVAFAVVYAAAASVTFVGRGGVSELPLSVLGIAPGSRDRGRPPTSRG